MMREGGLFITHMRMLISMSVFWIILDETSLQGIAQRTENEHMGAGGGGGGGVKTLLIKLFKKRSCDLEAARYSTVQSTVQSTARVAALILSTPVSDTHS